MYNLFIMLLFIGAIGVAVGMVMVSATVATYYGVIIAWAIFYMFSSLTSKLPWAGCDNPWNTEGECNYLLFLIALDFVTTNFGDFTECKLNHTILQLQNPLTTQPFNHTTL